jgi:uncharacterized protein (TIGR03437 family)
MPFSGLSKRLLLAALACSLPLGAQFSHLAATDDGERLYFTSQLILKSGGSPTIAQTRLYRLGPDGIAMIAEPGTFGKQGLASSGVTAPWVSGDGSVVGFTLQGVCSGGLYCGEVIMPGAKNLDLGPGKLSLSRNGKWALVAAPPGPPSLRSATLIELATGKRTNVPIPVDAHGVLASDGSIMVFSTPGAMSVMNPAGVWKNGAFTPFAPYQSGMVLPLALSDDASTFVFESGRGAGHIIARDLASGSDTSLFTLSGQIGPGQPPPDAPFVLGLSNNGQRVLFRVGERNGLEGPAYVADTRSGKCQPIPLADGELVSDGTLSGSGELAFLVTTTGRLVKVALSTGAVTTLIPPTPYARNFNWWAFGSLFRMKGAFTGSAGDWKDRILIDNQPAQVLYLKPGELGIQIPWSASAGNVPFRIVDSGAPPFQENELVIARPYAIAFEPAKAGEPSLFGMRASNGDEGGPPPSQPGPGDTFRLYMTGLGPVANQPPTGTPSPAAVSSPIQARLMCHFEPHTNSAETLSAGLEPGAIGVYQATFRLPDNAAAATLTGASCELCGPCDVSSPYPYHGRCGDACMVSGASTPMSLRGFTPVP